MGQVLTPDGIWPGVARAAAKAAAPGRTLSIVATPGAADGSGYHRMYQPFRQLAKRSRHLIMVPPPRDTPQEPPEPRDLLERSVDVYVAQRPASPHASRLWDALGGRVARVYETDDDLLQLDTSSGIAHLLNDSSRSSIAYLLASSDMVTCSTPYLAQELSRYSRNVVVLENVIHEDIFRITRPRHERLTVGWAGGSSHLMDVCAVQDPLRAVLDAHPAVRMHWVGIDYAPLVRRPCAFTPWVRNVWDYYAGVDFDIGLCPLADHPFNYSKSHLKALDMGALGIPVVAQDLPPYRDFVVDGVTGYLVRTPEQWQARLTELINDEAARAEMGAKAREHARGYTIQGRWQDWERAYERVAGGGR